MKICSDQGYNIKWHWSCHSNKWCRYLFYLQLYFLALGSTISKTSAMVSSGFQTRENIWNILLFLSVWKTEETRSTSFWNDFSKETIQNYAMLYALYMWFVVFSWHSFYFWAFVFNCPIVSRCTKFVFQKRYELEVIYILFLPWPKEGFASWKQSRKKNFA